MEIFKPKNKEQPMPWLVSREFGKTAIYLKVLAQRIASGVVPEKMKDKKILQSGSSGTDRWFKVPW